MGNTSDSLQGTLDLLILKTLKREPNHGFGITLHIQTASDGFLRVEEGSLYPALRRLEKQKLIKGSWKTTVNGRRARYYELLPAGHKRLSEVEQQSETLTKSVSKVLRFV
jgi:PadR family transcriptional regulator, regulatory protein PadR